MIENALPNQPFIIEDPQDDFDWLLHKSWEKGIPPYQVRKSRARDMHRIMEIESTLQGKEAREKIIARAMASMR